MPVTRFTVDPEYVLDLLKVRPCELESCGITTDGRLYFEVSAADIPEDAPECVVIHESRVVVRRFEKLLEAPPCSPPSSS